MRSNDTPVDRSNACNLSSVGSRDTPRLTRSGESSSALQLSSGSTLKRHKLAPGNRRGKQVDSLKCSLNRFSA